MGNYEQLKQAVSDVVKTNGNQEITGSVMQSVLLSMISSLGKNYQFAGIATPTTNPGTPDQNVFYLASEPGIYVNFGNIELTDKVLVFTNKNGNWVKQDSGISTRDKVPEIEAKIGYYACHSLETYSEKTISIPKFILDSKIRIIIRFTYANSVEEVYLNINNTGSKRLYVGDNNTWKAGSLIDIFYDGTNYQGTFYKTNAANEISFDSSNFTSKNVHSALNELFTKISTARDNAVIQKGLKFYPSQNKVSTIGAGGYLFSANGILGSTNLSSMELQLPNKSSFYVIYTDSSLQLKYINATSKLPLESLILAITGVSNDNYVIYVASSTYYIDDVKQEYILKNIYDENISEINSNLRKLNLPFDFGSNLMFDTYIAKNDAIIIPGTIQFNPNYVGGVVTSEIPIDSSVSYNYKGKKPFAGYIINNAGEKVAYNGDFKTYPESTSYVVLSFLTQDLYESFVFFKETEEETASNKILFSENIDILGLYGISLDGNDTLPVIGNGANVTWQNLGDSMSANDNLNEEGTDYLYNGETQYQQQGWGRRACQLLGINYNAVGGNFHNVGKSGWTSIQWANSLETLQMLKPNCDIYSIFLCTNDWGNNTGGITFGTLDDYKNYTYDGKAIKNTAKALKRIVDYIFSIQTEEKKTPYILFITPPRRGAWGYKYKSDNSVLYIHGDYEAIEGQYLEDVVNLIKDISEYEGFGCIDLFHDSIVPARLLSHMTKEELEAQDASQGTVSTDVNQDVLIDNLHQTGKGYNIIAQRVSMKLMSNTNLFQKNIVF